MSVPICALLVGCDGADARAVDVALRDGGYLPSINQVDPADLAVALRRDLIEVVVIDFDGTDSEDLIREVAGHARNLACVAIGASGAVETAGRALRAGADDYLQKEDLAYLPLAVERELREKAERASRARVERSVTAGTERLLRQTRAQARSFKALHEVAMEQGRALDPEGMARLTVERARHLINADAVGLYWWNESERRLAPIAIGGDGDKRHRATALGIAELTVRNRGSVVIEDTARLAAIAPSIAAAGFRYAVGVPLIANDRALGALVAGTLDGRPITTDALELFRLFAAQVAPQLESTWRAAERDTQVRRLEVLQRIAVAVSGVLDPAELGRLVADNGRDLTSSWSAALLWREPDDSLLAIYDNHPVNLLDEARMAPSEGATGLALSSGAPVLIDDYANWESAAAWAVKGGIASLLAIPLMVGDQARGCLVVRSRSTRHFKPDHIRLLTLLAAQVAPALEGAHQARAREEQARAFRALHDIAVAAGGVLDPGELSRLAVGHARELLGVDGAVVFVWDPKSGLLKPLHETESSSPEPPQHVGEGAIGMTFESGRPIVIDDYATFDRAMKGSAARGMVSAAAVPLIVEDRPVGALGVWTYAPRKFRPDEVQVLTLFAAQLAPALEAARAASRQEFWAHTFRTLHELAVAAGGVLEPAALARLATDNACDLLGAHSAVLVRFEAETGTLEALADNHPEIGGDSRDPNSIGATGIAYREHKSVAIEDYANWEFATPAAVANGVKSVLAVPILVQDIVIGCLAVRWNQRHPVSDQEAQLLSLLAASVGPSLEAARVAEEREVRARSFAALLDLAVAAGGVLEPASLARLAVDHARDLLGVGSAALLWGREPAQGLTVLADNHPKLEEMTIQPATGVGAVAEAMERREAVVVTDYQQTDPAPDWLRGLGLRSVIAMPLLVDDRPVGCLVVRSNETRHFGAADIQLLSLLASEVAPAIHAAFLHSDLQRAAASLQLQADTFRALHELGLAAGGILEPAALGETAARKARELLGVDSAGVLIFEEGDNTLRSLADTRKGFKRGSVVAFTSSGAKRLRRGLPLLLEDYAGWEGADQASVKSVAASVVVVPLQVRDRMIGTLGVRSKTRRSFTPAEVELLVLIASAVGPPIEAARLHAGLVDSESRFRAIFQTAPMTIGRIDSKGVMVEMNPQLETMTGYRLEEVIGRHFDAVPWAEGGFIDGKARRDLISGRRERVRYEKRLIRKDGSMFWAEITVSSVRTPGGELDFFYVMVQDVNERKVAEQALRESEIRKSAIVNSALDCIMAADAEGRLTEFNPAAERIFGHRREDVIGRDAFDILVAEGHRAEYRSQFLAFVSDETRTQSADRFETVGVRSNGSEFPVEISISMFEQDGRRIFSAAVRDLSEREQAVTATRESEAKSRFLASMSHELRTPLNSILGFSQLLGSALTGPLSDRQQRYVGHIESSGRHLLALINDVLDLSKVAAGHMAVDIDDVEVAPLIEEALAKIRPLADSTPVELILAPSLQIWARADRRRLLQVLLNLLSNAVKFTPAGGVIRVGLIRSGTVVEISVADPGIGIPPNHQERIFEEFTQVQVGDLDSQEGTGLGLALSRRLLTLMKGTIRLESEVGKGTVFTVSIPRAIRHRDRADSIVPELSEVVPQRKRVEVPRQ